MSLADLLSAAQAHEGAANWSRAAACYQQALASTPEFYGVAPWFQRYILDGAAAPRISAQQVADIYRALSRCLNRLNRSADSRLALDAACGLKSEADRPKEPFGKPAGLPVLPDRDAAYLRSRLTLVILTHYTDKLKQNSHLCPPGTRLIEATYESLVSRVDPQLTNCRKLLCVDAGDNPAEKHYIRNLEIFSHRNGFNIVHGSRLGLRGMLLKTLPAIQTPYLLLTEHDWRFAGPPLCMDYPVRVFDAFPGVNQVRFNQRSNRIARYDFLLEKEPLIPYPPLLRTSASSNNPSLMRVSTLRDQWLPMCMNDPVYGPADLGGTAFGLEEPLFKKHINDIRAYGFEKAHERWGTYILGNPGDPERIVHLGC